MAASGNRDIVATTEVMNKQHEDSHTAQCTKHSLCPASHKESLWPVQAEQRVNEKLKHCWCY